MLSYLSCKKSMKAILEIQDKIYQVRGVRVMLDYDLAALYNVETKVLKQAVRRNLSRFPDDFMFEMSESEYNLLKINLKSQVVTSNERGGRRYLPFAFTEQGVAMLSSVLRSERAVQVNISIMRAFVAIRNYVVSTKHIESELIELRSKLELLERDAEDNLEAINDLSEDVRNEVENIYQAIAALSVKVSSSETQKPRRRIGYKTSADSE